MTAPSDISVNGYAGKEFQRTAPAEFTGCTGGQVPKLENGYGGAGGWSYYEPGEIETLRVLDLDGTIIVINTRLQPEHQAARRRRTRRCARLDPHRAGMSPRRAESETRQNCRLVPSMSVCGGLTRKRLLALLAVTTGLVLFRGLASNG